MKRNILSFFMIATLLVSLCSCIHSGTEITLDPDGSGTVTVQSGCRVDALDAGEAHNIDLSKAQYFTYNGTEYAGTVQSTAFDDLAALNAHFDGALTLKKTTKNAFTLELQYDNRAALDALLAQYPDYDCTDEERKTLESSFSNSYTFHFPYPVKLAGAPHKGVYIHGHNLTVTPTELPIDSRGTLTFYIGNDSLPIFRDVASTAWYYRAVNAMAISGSIKGYADGTFRPEQTLSLAELCQVIARTSGLPVGTDQNGYWAGKAIQSCLDAGYIFPHQDYSAPVTREEAVSALARAYRDLFPHDIEASNVVIPDYLNISIAYLSDIVFAYEIKLCTGQDSHGTFNPKGKLKRAELCQLYANARLYVGQLSPTAMEAGN